jgi:sirohydrochlorin ferrochelatase
MNMFSLKRVKHSSRVGIVLAPALDADPFVSRVLLDRAKALSREPAKETVILVAHGPVDDGAVKNWDKDLSIHAGTIVKAGGFRAAQWALLRDDAAPEVRAAAVAALRAKVEAAGKDGGRAIVVPVLIARGGIEDKIPRDLKGLEFSWSGDALLPHAGFDRWVLDRAESAEAPR